MNSENACCPAAAVANLSCAQLSLNLSRAREDQPAGAEVCSQMRRRWPLGAGLAWTLAMGTAAGRGRTDQR